jgi:integrase
MELTLDNGKIKRVYRHRIIGSCEEMSKGQARAILQDWLRPFNEGLHTPTESIGFQAFYEKWERDLLPTYRESTRHFYQSTAERWVLPYFKDYQTGNITPSDCQQFMNMFGGKYSTSVLKHIRATLNCLFQTAVDWHYIKGSPSANLRLPEGLPVVRAKVLTPDQLRMVITEFSEPCRTLAMIAATTGLRESELFALKPEDFSNDTVSIRRRVYRGKVDRLKTKVSERDLPICAEVVAAVRNLAQRGPFLFLEPDGSGEAALEHQTRSEFARVGEKLSIPHFTWRSFRRSVETAMHSHHVTLKGQQAMLGHANPNMTLVYAEADASAKREAAEELAKLIFPICPKLSQDATPVASRMVM